MGGSLYVEKLHAKDGEDDDDDENDIWGYSYSGFQMLKGELFRAGIRHLEKLDKEVDQRKRKRKAEDTDAGSREYLDKAGILSASSLPTDEEALEYASKSIAAALTILRGWIREIKPSRRGLPPHWSGGFSVPGAHSGDLLGVAFSKLSPETMEEFLNVNYQHSKVEKQINAPLALYRVGLSGLWRYAKLPDNNQLIYPFEARIIADSVERVVEFLEDSEAQWKESAKDLIALMKRCGEQEACVIKG